MPSWTFFTDRDLGKAFPKRLRAQGLEVRGYWEEYGERALPDHEWLEDVGQKGWVVLTFDYKMRYSALAKASIARNDVRYMVLKGTIRGKDQPGFFEAALPRVLRFLNRHEAPFMAKIRRGPSGLLSEPVVEMWVNKEKLEAELA